MYKNTYIIVLMRTLNINRSLYIDIVYVKHMKSPNCQVRPFVANITILLQIFYHKCGEKGIVTTTGIKHVVAALVSRGVMGTVFYYISFNKKVVF